MTETPERSRAAPRWLVVASYPVGALLMTLFFVYLGFPYDLLAARYVQRIAAATRTAIEIGAVEPHVALLGPGLEMSDVRASRDDGTALILNRIFVRPAWSLAWLSGSPALHVDLESDVGNSAGTVTLGGAGGWSGELDGVKLRYLPLRDRVGDLDFDGTLDADVDLHLLPDAPGALVGDVRFELRDGSVAGAGIPVALPFERFAGSLRFGDEGLFVRLEDVALDGPMLAARVAGSIGAANTRPLDLEVDYEVKSETIAQMIGPGGSLHVGGTLGRPVTRRR